MIKLEDVKKYEGIIDPEKYAVGLKTQKCEICTQNDARYSCVLCKRRVCGNCYQLLNGICKICTGDERGTSFKKTIVDLEKLSKKDSKLMRLLKGCGAVKIGEFNLSSGRKSKYYIDIKKASTDPSILKTIAEKMSSLVIEKKIAGMELGAVPIAVALSLEMNLPYLIIRKGKKGYGTEKRIEGMLSKGERVLVVEDVLTTGGSAIDAVETLREAGAIVERVIAVVDREEGAKELLESSNIELLSLVTGSELLDSNVMENE